MGVAPKASGSKLFDALDRTFAADSRSSSPNGDTDTDVDVDADATKGLDDFFEKKYGGPARRDRVDQLEALRVAQENQLASQDNVMGLAAALVAPAVGGSFHLNYDDQTPLRSMDVGGPDQQQRLADFVTKSIENTANDLTVKGAMKKLGLNSASDLLPGVEVRLLNHQAIGVAWMVEKERSNDKGGILADDMGLGKTVQMIATMAVNQPKADDPQTTLVVVPAALLQQWKDEIDSKTNGMFTVHVHHGKDKLKTVKEVKSKDVVVTSYQTLCQDFNVPKNLDIAPEDEEEYIRDHGGILSQVKFYRVIADEAQFIRNRGTRASFSLALIKSKLRWMLTGTPVTNTLADIYGLLRFGRFRPWNDWNDFNGHIAKVQYEDAPLAGARAQAILKPILLRRTKDSELEGQPLLQLPSKHIEIVKLKFTPEEREVYDIFEKRTKIQVNRFMRNGSMVKNHAFILVMILRLRQVCCHPYLILSLANGFEDPSMLVGSDSDKELSRAKKVMGVAWAIGIQKRFMERKASIELVDFDDIGDDSEPEPTCPNCRDLYVNDSGRVLACGHEICFECTLELSNSAIVHDGIFGYGTEKENLAAEKEFEAANAKGLRPCPTCKKMMEMKGSKVFKSYAFEPSPEEVDSYVRKQRKEKERRAHAARGGRLTKKERSPSPEMDDSDSSAEKPSDSDEEMPDVNEVFAKMNSMKKGKGKKVVKDESSDEEMADIIPRKSSSKLPSFTKRKVVDDSDKDSDLDVIDHSKARVKRQRGSSPMSSDVDVKGKGKAKSSGQDGPSDAVLRSWNRADEDLVPSTKMLALLRYLKEWDASGDKTICYSQWTSMLDLIETLLSRYGIRSLRFDGKMDRSSRDKCLATFKQVGGPRIILISTKCGSVGLNLVSANRIVNMDLSWNYAAEAQAYDRCHRIGQEKEVHVKRLVVEDTIEDRMLRLQDVKTGLAEAALGEGTGGKLHKLSVKDIKFLFGMNKAPAGDANAPGNSSPPHH
ncbi:hypothetical protein D9619_009161 [Psilocybe cf. subviscida]|uniref:Uncharacterized protein n=1 Tax=Psilocybe cf. subviscida TaxID=2480587 RepID=A0A8H5BU56_9AGAR|nr:hypothetical protein D9619_009161 [Psilocybe cf. subviscida]